MHEGTSPAGSPWHRATIVLPTGVSPSWAFSLQSQGTELAPVQYTWKWYLLFGAWPQNYPGSGNVGRREKARGMVLRRTQYEVAYLQSTKCPQTSTSGCIPLLLCMHSARHLIYVTIQILYTGSYQEYAKATDYIYCVNYIALESVWFSNFLITISYKEQCDFKFTVLINCPVFKKMNWSLTDCIILIFENVHK